MNFLAKYSNGYGHLIMSVVTMIAALYLVSLHDTSLMGVGVGMISTVVSYWFLSGIKNKHQAQSQTGNDSANNQNVGNNTSVNTNIGA